MGVKKSDTTERLTLHNKYGNTFTGDWKIQNKVTLMAPLCVTIIFHMICMLYVCACACRYGLHRWRSGKENLPANAGDMGLV